MFEPIQIITFCQKEGTLCTPEAPQYAGMQGDSGKTRVDFVLPADAQNDAYVYRVEMVTGGGALVTGELLDPVGGIVSQVLTHPFTESGGRCTVRLIVTQVDENGDEAGEYCALVGHIYFNTSPTDSLPAVKHGISEMLLGVAADAELADRSASRAATDAASVAGNAQRAETAEKAATDAAAKAVLCAMETDAAIERISRQYAPAAAVSVAGNPAVLKNCGAAFLRDLEMSGNSTQSDAPYIDHPVPVNTAFTDDGRLTVTSDAKSSAIDLAGLCMDKWDTLFLDSEDGLWKIRRNTQTIVYSGTSEVYETSETSGEIVRYSIGGIVFNVAHALEDGICTHLPLLQKDVQSVGLMVGFGSGRYINIRLPSADFPDTASVKQWFAEQETAGTPVTVKFCAENGYTETLSQEWQDALNSLATTHGDNTVAVSGTVLPATLSVSAVADTQALLPTHESGLLTGSNRHVLQPNEICTAQSSLGGLTLYTADGEVLLDKLIWLQYHCTEESNGSLRLLVQCQYTGSSLIVMPCTPKTGAYLTGNGIDTYFASIH